MGKVVDFGTKEEIKNDEPVILKIDPMVTLTDAFYLTFSSLAEFLYLQYLQQNKGKKTKKSFPEYQRDLIYDIAKQYDLNNDDNKQ